MIDPRTMGFSDYLAVAKRRIWWIVLPVFIMPLLALGVARVLPQRFTSESFVLVQEPRVSDPFARSAVTEDLGQRLITLRERTLSPEGLARVIEKLPINEKQQVQASGNDLYRSFRKLIEISVASEDRGDGYRFITGFGVKVTAASAELAQQVCQDVTASMIRDNQQMRVQSAESTNIFLRNQLEQAKQQLDDRDAKLAEFQSENLGKLPDQNYANLEKLSSVTAELNGALKSIAQMEEDKTRIQERLMQLTALSDQNEPRGDSIQVASLRTQAIILEQATRAKRLDIDQLKQSQSLYESRVQMSPGVAQKFKQLNRDYQTALELYNDLLSKQSQSLIAANLERSGEGERFELIKAANLPRSPSFPNRLQFAAVGMALGLVIGLALITLLEVQDETIRTDLDVELHLKLPTLAMIPEVAEAPLPEKQTALGLQPEGS